jgi:hypothetical protein
MFIPSGLGQLIPEGGVLSYPGGGSDAPVADLVAADAALPKMAGLLDDDVKYLVLSMVAGNTYAQAKAALLAISLPQKQQPSDAAFAGWQAEVTRRAAMNPPYYGS